MSADHILVLQKPTDGPWVVSESAQPERKKCAPLRFQKLRGLRYEHHQKIHDPNLALPRSDYELFEKLFPSQDMTASSQCVATLYTVSFLGPRSIMGSSEISSHFAMTTIDYIARLPINTSILRFVAYKRSLKYAVTWSKQPCEDTAEGWRTTVREAKEQASIEYFSQAYELWTVGQEDM